MSNQTWLVLTYKVPPEPARRRIAIWRKFKGMGAVYFQNGVCMLPLTDEHVRRVKVVENEIISIGGEAILLETTELDRENCRSGDRIRAPESATQRQSPRSDFPGIRASLAADAACRGNDSPGANLRYSSALGAILLAESMLLADLVKKTFPEQKVRVRADIQHQRGCCG